MSTQEEYILYTHQEIDRLNMHLQLDRYLTLFYKPKIEKMLEKILLHNKLISCTTKEFIHQEYQIDTIIKTINEMDDILTEVNVSIELLLSKYGLSIPYLSCRMYSELYCWILSFRLALYSPITHLYKNNIIMLFNLPGYEINKYILFANSCNDCKMKQQITEKMEDFKEKINSIAVEFNIKLPEFLATYLSRSERIYRILNVEKQVEEGENIGKNIKIIIQNNDLNRYLMEFID